MDTLLAKISLLFSLVFGLIIGPGYIQTEAESFSFNFKTGENYPIIKYLNVKNTGPQKARFDISSNVSWVAVFKEGDTGAVSVELSEQVAVNFVLQVNAQYVKDGVNNAEITLNAVKLSDQSQTILDTKKINLVLNKNVEPAKTPMVTTFLPSETLPMPQISKTPSLIESTPTPIASLSPASTKKLTIPAKSSSSGEKTTQQTPPIRPLKAEESIKKALEESPRAPKPLFRSFWSFLKNLFY